MFGINIYEFVVIIIVIILVFKLHSYYVMYKNEQNEIIQRVKKDLNIIYLSYYEEKGLSPPILLDDLIIYEGDQSYTFNKKKIYLCLNDGENSYDYDMVMFVAIHELAHVICKDIGHTDEFWRINDELLEIAKSKGVYRGSKITRGYCPLY